MAINPIDTEVFVQNLKQAYTILRQNILICNTMVEMINNFNSLNTTGEQNTSDISELQTQVSSIDTELTQLNLDLNNLETKVNSNMSKTETAIKNITKDLTKKVTASDKQKIVYGTAVGSASPFEYQVLLSDEPDIQSSDRSIPTTAWAFRAVIETLTEYDVHKNAYFEWDSTEGMNLSDVLYNVSQLTGNNSFDYTDINKCPHNIICKKTNNNKMTITYLFRLMSSNGSNGNIKYYCITNNTSTSISFMYLTVEKGGVISVDSVVV